MLPIHMLKISITPNWIADIPRLSAIGRKIGVKIRIAGVISINIPITSRIMFIRRSRIYLLSVIAISPLLIAAGIPEYAITHDIADDAEIKNRMIPLVAALFSKIFIKDFILILLYTMDRIRQYSTHTPAPSVAVKIPPTIPPITITIKSRLGIASNVIFSASFRGTLSLIHI